jgi:hypothetical protein
MLSRVRTLCAVVVTGLVCLGLAWQGQSSDAPAPGLLPVLQSAGPRWYRGNLHTHSLWSDGDDFPEMIADWYKRNGYDFLSLTEHNVLAEGDRWINCPDKGTAPIALKKYRDRFGAAWVEERMDKGIRQVRLKPLAEFRSLLEEPGKFLLLAGEEITHAFARAPVHMNAIHLREVIKPVDGGSIAETISVNHRLVAEQARKTGRRLLAFLNHPNFGWAVRAEDLILCDELRFFEVYNGHPSVRNEGDATHPGCEQLWDIALALRLGKHNRSVLYGLATDDSHGYHAWGVGKVNPGRGWIMVRAAYLSPEAILRSIEAGDYYCSTGVRLNEVRTVGEEIQLEIHGEPGVRYRTEFIATLADANLDSTPRLDAKGNPLPVSRQYSKDIGIVVAQSEGLSPRYRRTGKELYVRARVTSDKPHPNPYRKGDVEMAWTQPVVGR